jgi:hypothetical protein
MSTLVAQQRLSHRVRGGQREDSLFRSGVCARPEREPRRVVPALLCLRKGIAMGEGTRLTPADCRQPEALEPMSGPDVSRGAELQ